MKTISRQVEDAEETPGLLEATWEIVEKEYMDDSLHTDPLRAEMWSYIGQLRDIITSLRFDTRES
jgi:hypothetical protein